VSPTADRYEVYALHFATLRARPASQLFTHYELYGLGDRALAMNCYLWLLRSGSRVVLVDTGYRRELGLGRLRSLQLEHRDPLALLSRLDVSASDVTDVIVSHMHLDHTGNLDRFPNAAFTVSGAELDYWTGPYSDRPALTFYTHASDVAVVRALARDGRVQIIGQIAEPHPGITLTRVGGHSPGQTIVEVNTGSGSVVLASDAIHYHVELERDLPFYVHTDLVQMFASYERLRVLADRPGTCVVSGHDPIEMDRFEQVDAHCVDLTKRIA
jgi:glyoxylase-like metal-dependent hydrolase (beta-lactamase superfamily II)